MSIPVRVIAGLRASLETRSEVSVNVVWITTSLNY